MNPRFSRTALGLPGKFIIKVFPLITDTPLDSIPFGVISQDLALIYSEIPGALRSATSIVASGVQSLGENPVPPDVSIRSTPDSSLRRTSSL